MSCWFVISFHWLFQTVLLTCLPTRGSSVRSEATRLESIHSCHSLPFSDLKKLIFLPFFSCYPDSLASIFIISSYICADIFHKTFFIQAFLPTNIDRYVWRINMNSWIIFLICWQCEHKSISGCPFTKQPKPVNWVRECIVMSPDDTAVSHILYTLAAANRLLFIAFLLCYAKVPSERQTRVLPAEVWSHSSVLVFLKKNMQRLIVIWVYILLQNCTFY